MALSLKNTVLKLENKFGKLGEAQLAEIDALFMESEDFGRLELDVIWKTVNKNLIDKNYIPIAERRSSMEDLFPSGDEYPDIYRGSLSELDMDDLL